MESTSPPEVAKLLGARFGPEEYVANTPGLSEPAIPRAVLALQAFNIALDELNYTGSTTPAIIFSHNLSINKVPRVSALVINNENREKYTLAIDVSAKVAWKAYPLVSIVRFKIKGMTDEQIAKMTVIETMFEEALHYTECVEGKISEQIGRNGMLLGFKGKYKDQEHEKRAVAFRKRLIEKYKNLYEGGENIYT